MTKVFVSYSHKDRKWKDRVTKHLSVPTDESENTLVVWDDGKISGGSDWLEDIQAAIYKSQVAVLLVSADFLTSKFVLGTEIPALLSLRAKEGLRILPLIIHDCAWQKVSWLARLQARPTDGKPLSLLTKARAESALAELAAEIVHFSAEGRPQPALSTSPPPQHSRVDKEEALRSRVEAEFEDVFANWSSTDGLEEKINNIVRDTYAPHSALIKSVDARLDHQLAPLIQRLVDIESRLRVKHRLPFTNESIDALREKIARVVAVRWEHIVYSAAVDAENHVFHNLGTIPEYKAEELQGYADKLRRSADYRGMLSWTNNLLKRAYADSILNNES